MAETSELTSPAPEDPISEAAPEVDSEVDPEVASEVAPEVVTVVAEAANPEVALPEAASEVTAEEVATKFLGNHLIKYICERRTQTDDHLYKDPSKF